MDYREEILTDLLAHDEKNICLEFATGTGKTKCAIEYLLSKGCKNILVLVHRRVQKTNWIDEVNKWGFKDSATFTFVCYKSIKTLAFKTFDGIICDECHHINANIVRPLTMIGTHYHVFLSATIKESLKNMLTKYFNATVISLDIHQAIENEILPDPSIFLIPLYLNKVSLDEEFVVNPKCTNDYKGTVYMRDYWLCKKDKTHRYHIKCTQAQKNNAMQGEINSIKNYMETLKENEQSIPQGLRNIHKLKCLEILKWLSKARESYTLEILNALRYMRTITFCSSIEQTEILGKNAIHSKKSSKKVASLLESFNAKKIKHITSVQMLNEGMNLTECKYGVFGFYNSGKGIQVQKVGRILRHKEPVLVLPYFVGTREEEIVRDMIEGYNPDNIQTIQITELDKLN